MTWTAPQDDDDAALLTDPVVILLYEAVRLALVEDRESEIDPVKALNRLREMMADGDREAIYALFMLCCLVEDMRRKRRARRRKSP